MNLIQTLEAEAIENLGKDIPEFRAGDTVRVGVKVVEGQRERVQNFEGVVIARSNRGMGSNFTVRKMSFGEGVERVFPLYSPIVDSITVVRRGVVRRAKLAGDRRALFRCGRELVRQRLRQMTTRLGCALFRNHGTPFLPCAMSSPPPSSSPPRRSPHPFSRRTAR